MNLPSRNETDRYVYKRGGIYAAAGGARVSADAGSNEVKPCQVSMLVSVHPNSRRSMFGALVGLRLEWNASWQNAQSPVSTDGCADETVRGGAAAGCECTTATNCATRINAAPKTAIDCLRLERVELLHEIAIQSPGADRFSIHGYIRVWAVNDTRAASSLREFPRDRARQLAVAKRVGSVRGEYRCVRECRL